MNLNGESGMVRKDIDNFGSTIRGYREKELLTLNDFASELGAAERISFESKRVQKGFLFI